MNKLKTDSPCALKLWLNVFLPLSFHLCNNFCLKRLNVISHLFSFTESLRLFEITAQS